MTTGSRRRRARPDGRARTSAGTFKVAGLLARPWSIAATTKTSTVTGSIAALAFTECTGLRRQQTTTPTSIRARA